MYVQKDYKIYGAIFDNRKETKVRGFEWNDIQTVDTCGRVFNVYFGGETRITRIIKFLPKKENETITSDESRKNLTEEL